MTAAIAIRVTGQPFNPYKTFLGLFIPEALASSRLVTPAAKLAYGHLTRRAGEGGLCYPSIADIAQHIGCSERHCVRVLKELETSKLIRKISRWDPSGRTTSNCFEFLWHPIFDTSTDPKPPQKEGDVDVTLQGDTGVTLPPQEGDVDVRGRVTCTSPSGVTCASPSFMKRVIGRESEEEEERAREAAAPENPPPPPPGDSFSETPNPSPPNAVAVPYGNATNAREYIAAHIGEFLSGYPGEGDPKWTVDAAVIEFEKEKGITVEDWWRDVMETLWAYANSRSRNANKAKPSHYWFSDLYHKRNWGPKDLYRETPEYPARRKDPEAKARRDEDSRNTPDTEADRLKAAGSKDACKMLSMPEGEKAPKKWCRKCSGAGAIYPSPTYEMVSSTMTTAAIEQWQKKNASTCPDCFGMPNAKAETA